MPDEHADCAERAVFTVEYPAGDALRWSGRNQQDPGQRESVDAAHRYETMQ